MSGVAPESLTPLVSTFHVFARLAVATSRPGASRFLHHPQWPLPERPLQAGNATPFEAVSLSPGVVFFIAVLTTNTAAACLFVGRVLLVDLWALW